MGSVQDAYGQLTPSCALTAAQETSEAYLLPGIESAQATLIDSSYWGCHSGVRLETNLLTNSECLLWSS